MEPTGPMMDGGFGVWQLVMLAGYVVVLCLPVAKVLMRVGFSGWWAILAVIPLVNLVALWTFAFVDWPRLPRSAEGEGP